MFLHQQISPLRFGGVLGDKNGCHVRDVGNAEVLGDMQDKGYVKLGGG